MGYKRNKVFVLNFTDDQFDGLKVEAKHCTYAEYMDVRELANTPASTKEEAVANGNALYGAVFSKLISWNLENEDDSPVELTLENFLKQDKEFTASLTGAWLDAVSGASVPLDKKSENGKQPEKNGKPDAEELGLMSSIPMTKPPESPQDSLTP